MRKLKKNRYEHFISEKGARKITLRGVLGLKISFPPTELAGIRKLSLALYQEMTGLGKKKIPTKFGACIKNRIIF